MRVLVLHQHYWPEIAATAQILSDLCEDLAAYDHDVTVVCGQPSYHGADRLPRRGVQHGVAIERVWSYTPLNRAIPQRLAHYVTYFGSSLAAALSMKRPDVVLVMSTPPLLLGVSGALLRAVRGVPFVYSVQDLYPDIALHLGIIKEGGPLATSIDLVASHCYRSAAALVTLSAGMGQRLVAKGLPPERVYVIPNWADTRTLRPAARDNGFARHHGLADSFVVQYSGNLGRSQGLEHLIAAADMLQDLPITFAFVGDGNARPQLQALVKERALRNVRFLDPQPRERLSESLSACDVGLVTMKRSVGDDLVPSKLYGIMAVARPMLASVAPTSEVARVLRAHDCGWLVAPESPQALAAGIRDAFAATDHERRRLGENGRAACADLYSRTVLTRRYEQVLQRAVGHHTLMTRTRPRDASPEARAPE